MGLKKMVLAGTALATMTVGFAAPAFAATQAAPKTVSTLTQSARTTAAFQPTGGEHGDDDVSGLVNESPVCSALGAESVPTGDVVAKCLAGRTFI